MRPQPIVVAAHAHYAARAAAAAQISPASNSGRPIGLGFANHLENHYGRPALRGFACVYGQVFGRGDGMLHAFIKGCFTDSLASGREIKLQLEHDPNIVFGSTQDGLKFVDTNDGLALEFEISDTQAGSMLTSIV
ncbi:HK97 family phage prohead protease, partial [Rhizobiaceae sp. 2RAB30]